MVMKGLGTVAGPVDPGNGGPEWRQLAHECSECDVKLHTLPNLSRSSEVGAHVLGAITRAAITGKQFPSSRCTMLRAPAQTDVDCPDVPSLSTRQVWASTRQLPCGPWTWLRCSVRPFGGMLWATPLLFVAYFAPRCISYRCPDLFSLQAVKGATSLPHFLRTTQTMSSERQKVVYCT
jgi:hypothetical protein